MDNRFYFVKDMWKTGRIIFKHINGTENPADGCTKLLHAEDHKTFRERLKIKLH